MYISAPCDITKGTDTPPRLLTKLLLAQTFETTMVLLSVIMIITNVLWLLFFHSYLLYDLFEVSRVQASQLFTMRR